MGAVSKFLSPTAIRNIYLAIQKYLIFCISFWVKIALFHLAKEKIHTGITLSDEVFTLQIDQNDLDSCERVDVCIILVHLFQDTCLLKHALNPDIRTSFPSHNPSRP